MNDMTTTTSTTAALALTEPTVRDIDLAERLGYERPANIRNLIKRHQPTLRAMGLVLHREAPIVSGKGRVSTVTEYHLNRAQAAFIVAKSDTKHADSLTVKMAEVFALFEAGGLVATDNIALADLAAIEERERQRRRAIHEEEKEARDRPSAFSPRADRTASASAIRVRRPSDEAPLRNSDTVLDERR